jgi:hypothetical protein
MTHAAGRNAERACLVCFLGLLLLACASCAKNGGAKNGGAKAEGAITEGVPFFLEPGDNAFVHATGGLFLRARASASSAKLAFMPYGESMTVIRAGDTLETIGTAKGYWLEVEFFGTRGWAFGGFVSTNQPPMATISGQAVGELYGYDRIGAFNLDSRQFYAIENHAKPFIGGIEDPDISDADLKDISERIGRDNEEACHFEIGGLPAGRYSVYTWSSGNPAQSLAYMEKGSYESDAREAQKVRPAVIELGSSGGFSDVAFENNVYFYCGGLPGQFERLPLSERGDFSLAADRCRTTRRTRLFGAPSDFLSGKATAGGKLLDLEAGVELRADASRMPMACGMRTLVSVLDGKGEAWWADAFDLAVGCGFRTREEGSGGAGLRDAVFILGRSGDQWMYRRMGKGMQTGSFSSDAGDAVPGAALVGAGILLEPGIGGFTDSGYSGDPGMFVKIMEELSKRDPDEDGVAEFKGCLRPYLE